MNTGTIRLADLSLALAAAKMRRANHGRTCQLAALTQTHTITYTCRDQVRNGPEAAARALKYGMSPARVWPMQRGDIGRVFERVKLEHGRREVNKTWGAGIRALQKEPQYVLNGGTV